jgi:hypothetical protein
MTKVPTFSTRNQYAKGGTMPGAGSSDREKAINSIDSALSPRTLCDTALQ